MTTINVNMTPCDCPPSDGPGQRHETACGSGPVSIHCPIPRSVTMTVRFGECTAGCESPGSVRALKERGETHHAWCPGKPIRVSCSIVGDTWEGSEVTEVEDAHRFTNIGWTAEEHQRILVACRARWEIVKAVLLKGQVPNVRGFGPAAAEKVFHLCEQRNTVFAALADMARAESTIIQRMADIDKVHTNRTRQAFRGVAADELTAYVEYLIEQVGALA